MLREILLLENPTARGLHLDGPQTWLHSTKPLHATLILPEEERLQQISQTLVRQDHSAIAIAKLRHGLGHRLACLVFDSYQDVDAGL
jgi:hypothetical protein